MLAPTYYRESLNRRKINPLSSHVRRRKRPEPVSSSDIFRQQNTIMICEYLKSYLRISSPTKESREYPLVTMPSASALAGQRLAQQVQGDWRDSSADLIHR